MLSPTADQTLEETYQDVTYTLSIVYKIGGAFGHYFAAQVVLADGTSLARGRGVSRGIAKGNARAKAQAAIRKQALTVPK